MMEIYRVETEAEKNNMEIIGFYHSHADSPAILSGEDVFSMISGCFYMIVSVLNGVCTDMKSYMKRDKAGEQQICEIETNSDDWKRKQ